MANRDILSRIVIRAKDETAGVFGAIRKNLGTIATLIAGYFTARTFGDAITSASEFEAAISRVAAASGASGEQLEQLRQAADAAGTTTKFTATEAASALETLAKAGLDSTQAVQALPAVLELAQAGGVELGEAADFVTRAVNGMGLSFADAGRVADVLAAGANASNTSVQGLAQALSFAAPVANSLGLSLEETAAIIGKFADAGIDASRAGTALNSILSQFSDPASRFRRELGAAGITTDDFGKALRQLAEAGPAGQKAVLAVGQEAGPALRALLNQGIGALDDLTGRLENARGSAAATAAVMTDNLDGAVTGLGSAWDALRRALVDPLLDPIKDQVVALTGRLRDLVSSGAAGRIGEAFRKGFEAAAGYLDAFLEKLDVDALVGRITTFADRVGEAFDIIGEKARSVGAGFDLVVGVFRAGFNVIESIIFKIAEAFAGVASNIVDGVALINEALAKITFGDLSRRFADTAREIRREAGALGAVSEAFARESGAAFDAALEGAEQAAAGWNGLAGTIDAAGDAVARVEPTVAELADSATRTAAELGEMSEGAERVAGTVRKVGTEAAAATPKVRELGTGARDAALAVEQAFATLGVKSTASLQESADKAKAAYQTIKTSGVASAADVRAAFEAYARKAIEANDGVASSSLRVEAAIAGVELAADGAGKALVTSLSEARREASSLATQLERVEKATARVGTIQGRSQPNLTGSNSSQAGGFDFSAGGGLQTRLGIAKFMESAGLDFDTAFALAAQFTDEDGTVSYFGSKGRKRGETISVAALRVAQKEIERQVGRRRAEASGTAGNSIFSKRGGSIFAPDAGLPPVPAAPPRTVRIELGFPGGSGVVNVASERDAQALLDVLERVGVRG